MPDDIDPYDDEENGSNGDAGIMNHSRGGTGRVRSLTPRPDPTLLTTRQLLRELGNLKELIYSHTAGLASSIEQRFVGMDKALILLQAKVDRSPSIEEVVAKFTEKLIGVNTQFVERDVRTENTTREQKIAIDAAFSAQKEAVSEQNKSAAAAITKSETATGEKIQALGLLIDQGLKSTNAKLDDSLTATNDKIDDLKTRMGIIDERASQAVGRSAGVASSIGFVATAVGVVAAIIGAVMAIIVKGGV